MLSEYDNNIYIYPYQSSIDTTYVVNALASKPWMDVRRALRFFIRHHLPCV